MFSFRTEDSLTKQSGTFYNDSKEKIRCEIMRRLGINPGKAAVIMQGFFIYIWLTVLSPLSGTDTYYSVYLLCGGVSLLCLCRNYKHEIVVTERGRFLLSIFCTLFALAVVLANYALFEPLSVIQNLFDLCCCLVGGFFAARAVMLYLLDQLPVKCPDAERCHGTLVFLAVFFSVTAIDLAYLLFAHYPGTLTVDSMTTIRELMGDAPYSNTMPFWHTVTVKLFVDTGLRLFGDMNAAVALFHGAQILFLAACFGYAVVTMYQSGVPGWFLAAAYAVYAFQPHNIVYSVVLWKDIPFAAAGLLFLTALYRILKDIGTSRRWNYVLFAIGAMGFSLWRTNGWYAFLVTVLVLLALTGRKRKKLILLMTVVLIFCWILINPVLDVLGVTETNFVEAFAVPMQQIARVVSEGRELTAEENALLGAIFWMDKLAVLYNPLTVDPVKFETFRYDRVDHILENAGEYLRLYFGLGLRYPGDYWKAWIDETKGYWNGGYFFWIYSKEVVENPYGITLTLGNNLIARLFGAVFRYLEKPAFLQPLTSIGLHVWALIACAAVNAQKKREELLLAVPLLVLVAGLWIGTPVYSEFRYAYPVFLGMPLILAATLFEGKIPDKK